MKYILIIISIFSVVFGIAAYIGSWYSKHPCIKSHIETIHHKKWTQLMPAGKGIIPIFHKAYDENKIVCDQRK